jgi:release factor glutamine methyltransferase
MEDFGYKNMRRIYRIQREMQAKFMKVPLKGMLVPYLDKQFKVRKSVLWPSRDSIPLVENYEINPGERVLDLCTGSGVIAIYSALKGASKSVALDINPEAIKCVKENAEMHGVADAIDARVSDMWQALGKDEKFDVITMNPPFTKHKARTFVEKTIWDEDNYVQDRFIEGFDSRLNPGGRIYMTQANFGAIRQMLEKSWNAGLSYRIIGKKEVDPGLVFYAFAMRRFQ